MLDEAHSFCAGIRISVDETVDHGIVDGFGDAVGIELFQDALAVALHRVKGLEPHST